MSNEDGTGLHAAKADESRTPGTPAAAPGTNWQPSATLATEAEPSAAPDAAPTTDEEPSAAPAAAPTTDALDAPEPTGLQAFIRYYVWLPTPAAARERERQERLARDETWLQAFIRYYVWLPMPAAALEQARQERAARTVAHQEQPSLQVAHAAAHTEHHPPYLAVFGWLIVLTAIEVFPIFTEIFFDISPVPHNIWIPVLLILAVIKATLVALYYMHLKYDQPWLVWALIGPLAFALFFGFAIVAS